MASSSVVQLESFVLSTLGASDVIPDSLAFAVSHSLDHKQVTSVLRSLAAAELVSIKETQNVKWTLTDEGKEYVKAGATPEVQVLKTIVALASKASEEKKEEENGGSGGGGGGGGQDGGGGGGVLLSQLTKELGPAVASVGFKQGMQLRWVKTLKQEKKKEEEGKEEGKKKEKKKKKAPSDPILVALVAAEDGLKDATLENLLEVERCFEAGEDAPAGVISALKKRKLVLQKKTNHLKVVKGPQFALERKKEATDLTKDMLGDESYASLSFKKYNFNAMGHLDYPTGHLHPLLKVRTQFRKIFVRMGFEEMPTNRFVESSFWNFDALFQPQQHPARDAHDTFFVTRPEKTSGERFPADYLERVGAVHEDGGYGSIGYRYNWKLSEAEKNILRTHTTAVSSRMLYKLAKKFEKEGKFTPMRYFSIDRVFRNESVDKTHLAEFHQCEGLVADYNLSLAHLIGTVEQFFRNIGMTDIKFKPAYNPYTEPSMEIFALHPGLGKWLEIGNSGIFRPEMLRPMGLPEGVSVIAWGLSLERPTMILYGVDNIRDLFGHKVDLDMMKTNPICRIGL